MEITSYLGVTLGLLITLIISYVKFPQNFSKNFFVTPLKMIRENNEVFIHAIPLADRLEVYFAYRATIESGRITKLWIYSDS